MAAVSNASGYIEFNDESSRIIVSVKEVEAQTEDTGMVALRATILDPRSLEPTEAELVVQMLPVDAFAFARTVNETAKREAWAFPSDAKFERWQDSKDRR